MVSKGGTNLKLPTPPRECLGPFSWVEMNDDPERTRNEFGQISRKCEYCVCVKCARFES
jgi:hypothetical protein